MDRKNMESVELFRAFTVEEIREREENAALSTLGSTPFRGENSSSNLDN